MDNDTNAKALPVLIKDYCGRAGETFSEFKTEYAKLTPEDRDWFRAEFEKMGVSVKAS